MTTFPTNHFCLLELGTFFGCGRREQGSRAEKQQQQPRREEQRERSWLEKWRSRSRSTPPPSSGTPPWKSAWRSSSACRPSGSSACARSAGYGATSCATRQSSATSTTTCRRGRSSASVAPPAPTTTTSSSGTTASSRPSSPPASCAPCSASPTTTTSTAPSRTSRAATLLVFDTTAEVFRWISPPVRDHDMRLLLLELPPAPGKLGLSVSMKNKATLELWSLEDYENEIWVRRMASKGNTTCVAAI
ncbi:hypothetical protein BS78_08G141500 [Paspalum vaginatum]|nr:hypothetical protein BS78_08G141500 [Paspalum vaginatum]